MSEDALSLFQRRDIIGEYFNYTFDSDFLDIVENILDRVDDYSNEDEITDAISDELTYTADLWTVAKFYANSPADLDWDSVMEDLYNDIVAIAEKILESQEDEL